MLGCAAADAPTAPRHCDLALESTMPQTKWCGTPGGVGAMGGINMVSRHGEAGIAAMVIVADLHTEKWSTDVAVRADGDLVFCPRGTEVKIFGVLKPYSEVFST